MNDINNIEQLVKDWIKIKTKEELLSVQRKEIEKNIHESIAAGKEINPAFLNLLYRILKITKNKNS